MAWCEQNRVDFVFGLARNTRLETRIAAALQEARTMAEATGRSARVFRDFLWSTKETWSRRRRVIAKAEWIRGEANPDHGKDSIQNFTQARWPEPMIGSGSAARRGAAPAAG